jgi:hypothetical protein
MKNKLKQLLNEKTVIFDGAIGTEIYKKNFLSTPPTRVSP